MTKRLRTSGGDCSSVSDWLNYLYNTYTAIHPMTETEYLLVQAGAVFQSFTDYIIFCYVAGPNKTINFSNQKIVIMTDSGDDIATLGPGAILGNVVLVADSADIGNASVEFRGVVCSQYGVNTFLGASGPRTCSLLYENCIYLAYGLSGNVGFTREGTQPISCIFRNCMNLLWGETNMVSSKFPFFGGTGSSKFDTASDVFHCYNNIFFAKSAPSALATAGLFIGGTQGVHTNNTYQNYDGEPTTITADGTIANSLGGVIGFGTTFIAAYNDSAATVMGLLLPAHFQLTAGMSYVLDNADPATAAALDYLSYSRPYNVIADRGPHELGLVPSSADYELSLFDLIRDTTKFAASGSNYEAKPMLQTDAVSADAVKTDAVTEIQAGLATSANQTTILNRIGAFTGTGLNTILGFLRSIMRKDAALTPSDVGGTFDNTTDSLEALADDSGPVPSLITAINERTSKLFFDASNAVSMVMGSPTIVYGTYPGTYSGVIASIAGKGSGQIVILIEIYDTGANLLYGAHETWNINSDGTMTFVSRVIDHLGVGYGSYGVTMVGTNITIGWNPAVDGQINAGITSGTLIRYRVEADMEAINAGATSGNNATLKLKQLNIVNSAGDAIVGQSTGGNGNGMNLSGNGTGKDISAKEITALQTSLTDIEGTGFIKDTDSLKNLSHQAGTKGTDAIKDGVDKTNGTLPACIQ